MTTLREPLLDRAHDAILFRDRQRAVTARRFLADVARSAARLPDAAHILNLCQDRYRFAVLFAACAVAGRIALLSGDQSPHALAALRTRYPPVAAIDDAAIDGSWLEIADGPAGGAGIPISG